MKIYCNLILLFFFLLISFGCFNNNKETTSVSTENVDLILQKIKSKISFFSDIEASRRNMSLIALRFYDVNDSTSILFLLQRNDKKELLVKITDKWIHIDNVSSHPFMSKFNVIKKKLLIYFTIMEELYAYEIYSNEYMLIIELEESYLYYIYDNSYFDKHKLDPGATKIDSNWWSIQKW